jgi:glyoxylase-like metal-dependent hydrolase (beta-lactamase superfamily II)
MRFTVCLALAAAAIVAACSRSTSEQQTVAAAAEALGGSDRIQSVRTLVIEGEGTQGNLGQDVRPEATGQTFTVSGYRRAIDLAGMRARTELTRVPNFQYFAGQMPQRIVQGLDGQVGYNIAANGTATRTPNAAAGDRRVEFYHHPITSVRAALDPGAMVTNPRTENGQNLVDVRTGDDVAFTLAVDAGTMLPARVISTIDNANLGDVVMETTFADYQDVNGLQLPARLTTRVDEVTTADIRASSQVVDGDAGDLAAPAAAASAPAMAAPPATVAVEELAPRVWLLAGQSHHSVLVEFDDHLTLIEAPQNEPRALAVIARARELRPNKPLTQLVVSHHHFDHSAGVRAAMAEGLTVIAHANAAEFLEEAGKRPHTAMPDALAKAPKAVTVEGVEGERALMDGTMTVNLYTIDGNPHADTLLMAYFPRERLLVEADVYTPGAAVAPYAPNLLENVRKRNLRVDRVVPLHGKVVPFSELVKVVPVAATN